jgi:hypothetical protein
MMKVTANSPAPMDSIDIKLADLVCWHEIDTSVFSLDIKRDFIGLEVARSPGWADGSRYGTYGTSSFYTLMFVCRDVNR